MSSKFYLFVFGGRFNKIIVDNETLIYVSSHTFYEICRYLSTYMKTTDNLRRTRIPRPLPFMFIVATKKLAKKMRYYSAVLNKYNLSFWPKGALF